LAVAQPMPVDAPVTTTDRMLAPCFRLTEKSCNLTGSQRNRQLGWPNVVA